MFYQNSEEKQSKKEINILKINIKYEVVFFSQM